MVFHFRSNCPSTFAGQITMGVHDDATASVAPGNIDQVLNLRVSRQEDAWKDFSLDYVPVDQNRWYYINADAVGDSRFIFQGTLYVISSAITLPANAAGTVTNPTVNIFNVGSITVEYHYVFDGATNTND
jgi:hypothetical protein